MLAIAGGKGGNGTTTTALGLARALPGPAMLADADVDMPDLHRLAAVEREPTLAAVGERPPEAVARPAAGGDSVSVLPAPRTVDADLEAPLERLRRAPPTALVDCPGGVGPDSCRPLAVADATVLVSPPCAPALRDTRRIAAAARELGTRVTGVVLTRTTAAPRAVERLFDVPVLTSVPDRDPPVLANDAVRTAYDDAAAALQADAHLSP